MSTYKEDLVILNASYATATHKPREEHIKSRIAGSIWFDFNEFSNRDIKFSYTVPTE